MIENVFHKAMDHAGHVTNPIAGYRLFPPYLSKNLVIISENLTHSDLESMKEIGENYLFL